MNKLIKNEIIKIADIHKQRITYAREKLSNLIPFTAEKIQNLSEEEFLVIELMVNRFSKLQDYIGSKVIDLFFEIANENYKNLTMLDKLHKLEKFNIIENKDIWLEIRELRNNLAHEYPEHPELTALFLNQTYYFSQELIKIYYKLQEYIMKGQ